MGTRGPGVNQSTFCCVVEPAALQPPSRRGTVEQGVCLHHRAAPARLPLEGGGGAARGGPPGGGGGGDTGVMTENDGGIGVGKRGREGEEEGETCCLCWFLGFNV